MPVEAVAEKATDVLQIVLEFSKPWHHFLKCDFLGATTRKKKKCNNPLGSESLSFWP